MNQERWTQFKKAFYEQAVVMGLADPADIAEAFPLGTEIPAEKLERWLKRMLTVPDAEVSSCPRLINHYKLGADPEFVFGYMQGGKNFTDEEGFPRSSPSEFVRVDATNLGLKQGAAFGADNNGRLAEIRPYPSRSSLEVVASLLSAMRWLAITVPKTRSLEWRSGAYVCQDGLGGHIHLGRKRPSRRSEVAALDVLADAFLALGLFPAREVQQRRGGDAHRQVYGMPGDIRLQAHGYEYRTLPSWLDSPWLAFFILTVAKLAVSNPTLVQRFAGPATGQVVTKQRIVNLLSYYQGVDDDARLCRVVLERRGFPTWRGGDFRPRWGIDYTNVALGGVQLPEVVPPAIKASQAELEELFEHLVGAAGNLRAGIPSPTWSPTAPPHGYEMVLKKTNTHHVKGLGEMVWDLCVASAVPLKLTAADDPPGEEDVVFYVSPELKEMLPQGWRKDIQDRFKVKVHTSGAGLSVYIPTRWRELGRATVVRKILTCGLFPVWKVGEVTEGSLKAWQKVVADARNKPQEVKSERRFLGQQVYPVA